MCGIDGRVVKERPEREVRYANGLRGGSTGVDSEDGFAVLAVVAAAASVAATASALSKVSVGSLLRSQVGWVVNNVVLACSAILLSSRGCVR